MKNLIAAGLLFFGAFAQAALVDNGSFTTDTGQGLDWLDLSATSGLSYSEALAANTDWRLATNSEVEALFSVAFEDFHSSSDGYNDYQDNSDPNPYAACCLQEDILNWYALFGYSNITPSDGFPDGPDPYVYWGFGLYQDENNDTRMMGANSDPYWEEFFVYGTESSRDYAGVAESGRDGYGVFLVKTSVVPIPAAAWLFASGLGFLGWLRRRQA